MFVAAAGFGVWLRWPAVHAGFYMDDSVQIAMLRGQFPAHRSTFDLFRFADEARDGTALVDAGYDPWWTEPGFRVALFRPLSSLLFAFDYAAFGLDATRWHYHSILWSVALVAAASLVFSRTVIGRALPLSILLFALHESQTAPFVWLANRSTLVSAVFAFAGVFIHANAERRRGARLVEAGAFLLALLGGEYGYGAIAYVVAYEVFEPRERREKIRALLPALVPAVLCIFGSALLGYGARGSASYLSPFNDSGEFLRAIGSRVPALYGDLFLGRPAGDWSGRPLDRSAQEFMGLVGLAAFAWGARFAAEELAPRERRAVHALAFGSVLSAIPTASGIPEDRLLVVASLGACGVFATFVVEAWRRRPRFSSSTTWALPNTIAALLILPLLKIGAFDAPRRMRSISEWFGVAAPSLRRWAENAEIPETRGAPPSVFLVAGADFTTNANVPWLRALDDTPLPRTFFRLSGSPGVHEILRVAPNVLEMKMLMSDAEGVFAGGLYRSTNAKLRVGDVFRAAGVKVEVLTVDRMNPRRLRFTFERDVDSPDYVFVHPIHGHIERVRMPEIGEKLRLPIPEQPPM